MNTSTITPSGALTLISFISVIAILAINYRWIEYNMRQNFTRIAKAITIIAGYTLIIKALAYIASPDMTPAVITFLVATVTIATYIIINLIIFIDQYYREDYLYSLKWQIFSIVTMIAPWVIFLYEINQLSPELLSKWMTTTCVTTVLIYSHPILQVLDDAKSYRTIKKLKP